MDVSAKIEAVLFWKGEPVRRKELAKLLGISENDVTQGIATLQETLTGRGLTLTHTDDTYELRTHPEASELIESLTKDELKKDLGKAGLETLAIVLYQGPVSRAQIDFIRGVNSTFILRNLLVRGLVEKVANPEDKRGFLYQVTHDALGFLGVSSAKDMPEFDAVQKEIEQFMNNNAEKEATPETTE